MFWSTGQQVYLCPSPTAGVTSFRSLQKAWHWNPVLPAPLQVSVCPVLCAMYGEVSAVEVAWLRAASVTPDGFSCLPTISTSGSHPHLCRVHPSIDWSCACVFACVHLLVVLLVCPWLLSRVSKFISRFVSEKVHHDQPYPHFSGSLTPLLARSCYCLVNKLSLFLTFWFQSQGEAGVRRPRSIKNKSSGPLAKMVTKGANPVTPEKRQKKSLFLCNGAHPKPSHAGCSPQPSERSRGQCVFSLLWCFLLSLLFLLFLRKRYKKSTFWLSKHIFGLPRFSAFVFQTLFLMPSTKSQQLFHGPYLNFTEAATHCPAWCGFWKLMK